MKLKQYFLIILLTWFSSCLHAADSLTKESLQDFMTSMDKALQQREANNLVSHFTDDAVIILRFAGLEQGGMKFDVKGYQQRLVQAWSMPMTHQYQTKALKTALLDDGTKAIIESIVVETVTFDSAEIMVTETKETLQIVNHDGQPKIFRLEGILTVK